MLGAHHRQNMAGLHTAGRAVDNPAMPAPTVAGLCVRLDPQLLPAAGFEPPATTVTAVHISELVDPTPYLSGGELLLTTGLALPRSTMGCQRYVRRLVEAQISALGLGLGPVHAAVPETLARACRDAGLCLLVVPAPTPFLVVTKAYWSDLRRAAERELGGVLTTQQRLVDAATGSGGDPEVVLAALVQAVGTWGAVLDPDGDAQVVWPRSATPLSEELSEHLDRMRFSGVRSAASLLVEGWHVATYPLVSGERVLGYLALASARPLLGNERRLVLTACALLSLAAVRRRDAGAEAEAGHRSVCLLLDLGLPDAAVALAARLGTAPLGARVRLLAVAGPEGAADQAVAEVRRWAADALVCRVDDRRAWFVVPVDHPPLEELRAGMQRRTPSLRSGLSPAVALAEVPRVRVRLMRDLAAPHAPRQSDGRLATATGDGSRLEERLAELVHQRVDLTGTLVEYLRHRGQWDPTARALGVHRNTVRQRIQRCRELLDVSPDDPDVGADLWLLLRERGLTDSGTEWVAAER